MHGDLFGAARSKVMVEPHGPEVAHELVWGDTPGATLESVTRFDVSFLINN